MQYCWIKHDEKTVKMSISGERQENVQQFFTSPNNIKNTHRKQFNVQNSHTMFILLVFLCVWSTNNIV